MTSNFYFYQFKTPKSRECCRELVTKTARENFKNPTIKLLHNQYGAPFLKNCKTYISYSTNENALLIAFSDQPIGIDLEPDNRQKELESLTNLAFSDRETANHMTDLSQWCLKEASLKLAGTGFHFSDPNHYTLLRNHPKFSLELSRDNIINGYYRVIDHNDYLIAICQNHIIPDVKIIKREIS